MSVSMRNVCNFVNEYSSDFFLLIVALIHDKKCLNVSQKFNIQLIRVDIDL